MSHTPHESSSREPGLPVIDVNEYGGKKGDSRQVLNRRLFMQLLVFHADESLDLPGSTQLLAAELRGARMPFVIYEDVNNPRGLGLLTWSEEPADFVRRVRPVFSIDPLRALRQRPEFTMLGRTYSTGHEPRLEHSLLERPREMALLDGWPWAVWYPLRRSGEFARLDPHEQATILREHATIGMAYGQQSLAHDIRLACHGLDANDNEFVVGLLGRELHPLSHVVQAMRRTRQTSEFISQMGPFFVGYATIRSAG